jgi:hypothetical protein
MSKRIAMSATVVGSDYSESRSGLLFLRMISSEIRFPRFGIMR